ncbi:hypothetical protein ABW21_db0201822 [Orbilia brochopaga]|nr:hypothetical protein ABW21_db0201822 [Drechslerella brochopaga]
MKTPGISGTSPAPIFLLLILINISCSAAISPFLDIAIFPSSFEGYQEARKRTVERIFGSFTEPETDDAHLEGKENEIRLTKQETATLSGGDLRKRQEPDDETLVGDTTNEDAVSNQATYGGSQGSMELEQGDERNTLNDPNQIPSNFDTLGRAWFTRTDQTRPRFEDTNLIDANGEQGLSGLLTQLDRNAFAWDPVIQHDDGDDNSWIERPFTFISNKEPESFIEEQYAMAPSDSDPFSSTFFDLNQYPGSNNKPRQNLAGSYNFDTPVPNRPSDFDFKLRMTPETIAPSWGPFTWSLPQQVIEDLVDPNWNPFAARQQEPLERQYSSHEAIQLRQPRDYARQKYTAFQRCERLRNVNPRLTLNDAARYNSFLDIYGYPVIDPPDSLGPYLPNSVSDPSLNFYQEFLDRFQVAEKDVLGEDGRPTGVMEPVLFEPAQKNYGCNAILYKEKRFCELRATAKAALSLNQRERIVDVRRVGKFLWYAGTPYRGLTPLGYKILDYFVTKRGLHNSVHWIYRACGVRLPLQPGQLTHQLIDIYIDIRMDITSGSRDSLVAGHDGVRTPHFQASLMLPSKDTTLLSFRWNVVQPRPAFAVPGACLMSMLEAKAFPCPAFFDEQIRAMLQETVDPWASSTDERESFPRFADLVPVGEWERRWVPSTAQWRTGMVVPTAYDNDIAPPLR